MTDLTIAIDNKTRTIARSGSMARIHLILEKFPDRGLTIPQISEMTGLTINSTYVALRDLINLNRVEQFKIENYRIYQLRKADISVNKNDARGGKR